MGWDVVVIHECTLSSGLKETLAKLAGKRRRMNSRLPLS